MPLKTPKVGDPVLVNELSPRIYFLTKVDVQKKVADVQSTTDASILHQDVRWDLISPFDENV